MKTKHVKFLSWQFDWRSFGFGLLVGLIIFCVAYGLFVFLALHGFFLPRQ